ncbi:uncharacterized protein LOC122246257 [Penaeus japonicus]|uniref:uncharacterized protein LOC122246257 n=1 Tax=Penaeus japonicus TaxID=27405 RepID=UPI001C7145D1|nr:uncharacterized protein LOC122246257 [Penaeus japonicus]
MYFRTRMAQKLIMLLMAVVGTWAHGRLMEPPSRASAWRLGFGTPTDYNDNEGFCGGFSHQYYVNDGKCGICGDSWDVSPRPHEVGGLYATGTIVRQYQEGQTIEITADITSNHRGHFEVRICPDPAGEATQECLDLHQLELADGSGFKYNISTDVGKHSMNVRLPSGLTCAHCVLQWRYVTGNNWGICEDGTGSLGCGPQEEFRACADVAVSPVGTRTRWSSFKGYGLKPKEDLTLDRMLSLRFQPREGPSANSLLDSFPGAAECHGVGEWAHVPGVDVWCTRNCLGTSYCPAEQCWCQ